MAQKIEHLSFSCQGFVEIYEMHHVAILDQMFNKAKTPFDWTKKELILSNMRDLIAVVFQPYDGDYEIKVWSSHIAIDRKKDGSRLGVVGITHD